MSRSNDEVCWCGYIGETRKARHAHRKATGHRPAFTKRTSKAVISDYVPTPDEQIGYLRRLQAKTRNDALHRPKGHGKRDVYKARRVVSSGFETNRRKH